MWKKSSLHHVHTTLIMVCSYERILIIVIVCWQVLQDTVKQNCLSQWTMPQCDALEMVLRGPCRVFMCSTVLKWWSLMPGGNLLPLVFWSEASVILNILTWCCTRTQNILPHSMTSTSSSESTDQEQPTSFFIPSYYKEFILRVSVLWCTKFGVKRIMLNQKTPSVTQLLLFVGCPGVMSVKGMLFHWWKMSSVWMKVHAVPSRLSVSSVVHHLCRAPVLKYVWCQIVFRL